MGAAVPRSLVIDTNVWLDYYLGFRAGHRNAVELLDVANALDVTLLCSVTATKDLFYLIAADFKREYRRCHDGALSPDGAAAATEVAWACLRNLEEIATAVGCDQSDVWMARAQRCLHEDYEDNLVIAAAQRSGADLLVTNDESLVRHSPVAALTCEDALLYLRSLREGTPT